MVRFRNIAMRNWQCRIAPGTRAYLSEAEFVAETEAAIQNLLSDYRREILFLKDRCYDLEIAIVREARLRAEAERAGR